MGTWGTGLYQDDVASGLKSTLAPLGELPFDGDRIPLGKPSSRRREVGGSDRSRIAARIRRDRGWEPGIPGPRMAEGISGWNSRGRRDDRRLRYNRGPLMVSR